MFGVYAAADDRHVTVNGTVSFTAKFVDATVSAYEVVGTDFSEAALFDSVTFTTIGTVDQAAKSINDLGTNEAMALDDEHLVYSYKLVVEADGVNNVWVKYSVEAEKAGVKIVVTGLTGGIATATPSVPVTIVVTYTITPSEIVLNANAGATQTILGNMILATTEAGLSE